MTFSSSDSITLGASVYADLFNTMNKDTKC